MIHKSNVIVVYSGTFILYQAENNNTRLAFAALNIF